MTTTPDIDYGAVLAETLPVVRDRMDEAARAAGRDPGEVRLVAVSKGHPVEAVQAALAAGLRDLGENRIWELEEKVGVLGPSAATWHMIGHIQSRKAAKAAALADLVHSVDSIRLGERLARARDGADAPLPVLVQVNTSGEEQKYGLEHASAVEEIHRLAELPGLRVEGLMAMAPFVDDEAVLGATFRRLRETLERVRSVTDRVGPELSMGMTNDLHVAIREGSTMVRVGTALFGERR